MIEAILGGILTITIWLVLSLILAGAITIAYLSYKDFGDSQ